MLRLIKELELAAAADLNPMIWGRQGIGKTTLINEFGENTWGGSGRTDPACITLILSQMDGVELAGLPKVIDGRTIYARPNWMPENDEGGIILLDELNRADKYCINAAHQLVLEHRIFENELPPNWMIVAACNPETDDERGMTRFGAAFMDRFCHIECRGYWESWAKWAKGDRGISNEIIAFLDAQTTMLSPSEEKFNFDDILKNVIPTPRSWDAVDRVFQACGSDIDMLSGTGRILIKGLIGKDATAALFKHLKEFAKKTMTLADILKHGPTDPRWKAALKEKDLAYMQQTVEIASNELKDEMSKLKEENGDKGETKVKETISKNYNNLWELLKTLPDDTLVGFWNGLPAGTIWDHIASGLPLSFRKYISAVYHKHMENKK